MPKTLVIVESPTKARTISRFLGNDFVVESSYGHVRDLPRSRLGIDLENNFAPHYIIPAKAKPVIKKLKDLAARAGQHLPAAFHQRVARHPPFTQTGENPARVEAHGCQARCAPGRPLSTTKDASVEIPLSARFSLSSARSVAVHALRLISIFT